MAIEASERGLAGEASVSQSPDAEVEMRTTDLRVIGTTALQGPAAPEDEADAYDPIMTELRLDEMRNDGQRRHKIGLDAIDLAEAFGEAPSFVRTVFGKMEERGEFRNLPSPRKATREGGQKTYHYGDKIQEVFLPALAAAKEAKRRGRPS